MIAGEASAVIVRAMDDVSFGAALRSLRIRRGWRQEDLAARSRCSRWQVGRVERGRLDQVGLPAIRRIARALGADVDLRLRWQGADLDRLLNARHSRFQEQIVTLLGRLGWVAVPEASFSHFGERGVVDILAWHAERGALLVVELKTAIVDVGDLVATMDRRRRLAWRMGRDRGWAPATVSVWVAVTDERTNRRRVAEHAAVLRAAFPSDGRRVRCWLRRPDEPIAALGFVPEVHQVSTMSERAGRRRVRPARSG